MTTSDRVALFIHGHPLDHRMWQPQLEAVRGAGWTPVTPNLPGFGGAPLLQDTTMDAYAEHVRQILLALGAKSAVIVGLSMGGYVAFRLVEKYPDLVQALVLADTRATPDTPEQAAARLENAAKVEAEGYAGLVDGMLEKFMHQDAPAAAKDSLRRMIFDASWAGAAAANRAMSTRPDSRPLLGKIDVPTLIIVGQQDAVTPVEQSNVMLEGVRDAQLKIIKNAGHMSNLEQPEAFNAVLLEFLQKL
jgi:pimeloyl-ACP methyl ester carboxylesterase